MRLIGLMPVRNEAWCLGFTLRVALKWCDAVVVLMHACTDGSSEILLAVMREHPGRIAVMVRPETDWTEMEMRNQMLGLARSECQATHIALVDADEFVTANLLCGEITAHVWNYCKPGTMLELPMYNTRGLRGVPTRFNVARSLHRGGEPVYPPPHEEWRWYHANGVWGNRFAATAFQDSPALYWAGDRFHHREPMGCGWNRVRPIRLGDGGTIHLWGASERRLRAKHALYRITERLRWPNRSNADIEYTYDPATNPQSVLAQKMGVAGPWRFEPIKPEWIEPYADLMQYLDIAAVPWQEQEIVTLLALHGRDKFRGLDLLGY